MKKSILIFVILMLTIASTTIAFAQTGNQVLVNPYYQDEITVTTDDELVLATEWYACTPGLVKAWISTSSYGWYLDNFPISIVGDQENYWGPIEFAGPTPYCIIGTGNYWGSSWRYSIGSLPIGTYVIGMTFGADHKFLDGGDYDGDGKLDFGEGQGVVHTVTIHVEAP